MTRQAGNSTNYFPRLQPQPHAQVFDRCELISEVVLEKRPDDEGDVDGDEAVGEALVHLHLVDEKQAHEDDDGGEEDDD